ncbi:non-ribosomal peptide synthase domain TIGR01720/amino acid adenylation domain-containing protein [Chryseolinea serpens]|uniref:Non-ribosomal peptide synthase domain TIGR01720/amino acid adenylation domain-containing protein n=1 Tax=Chryseolinea serpens TaxID=947013 RepID=A0A1M5XUG5_9BACT|nr:non-ribosomal peptide synthetase [Chryseolinea serpens]SHI03461.1 non-ribosomal peptide synthase domain TIGR01720/amino acid adenylation domain-containing protein [Chryseolinea serpens]
MNTERSLDRLRIYASQHVEKSRYWQQALHHADHRPIFEDVKMFPAGDIETATFRWEDEGIRPVGKIAPDPGSLLILLLSGLRVLLWMYTGERSRILCTPVPGNPGEHPVNRVIPLRNTVAPDSTFKQMLFDERDRFQEAHRHADFPTEMMVENLVASHAIQSSDDLFTVGLSVSGLQDAKIFDNLNLELHFRFSQSEKGLTGQVQYNTGRYTEARIQRMIGHFRQLLLQVLRVPDTPLTALHILTAAETTARQQFNNTATPLSDQSVLSLWLDWVERAPHKIAVTHGDTRWTYADLDNASNAIAATLRQRGCATGSLVAISMQRSPAMLAGILAIGKAGGTFLLIDTALPDERVQYMLEDSQATMLLCDPSRDGRFASVCPELVVTETQPVPTQLVIVPQASTAYVLYTSGSTGMPKGVRISQRALSNYIQWAADQYVEREESVFALHTSISFDLTLTSIFVPLVSGGCISIPRHTDAETGLHQVFEEGVFDIIKLTPSHLRVIQTLDDKYLLKFADRRLVFIVGGEDLDEHLARSIDEKFKGNITIYNEYGPTEATVGCMIFQYGSGPTEHSSVAIGKPIANTTIDLLDEQLRPVPTGLVGEIYIGGAGLAEGYHNQDAATRRAFIIHPESGVRLYRSGDYARQLENGDLLYLGRKDGQLKVRGHRVDAGEVEHFIRQYPGIADAAVTLIKGNITGSALCGYYITTTHIDDEALVAHLEGHLPSYAIPSRFCRMEKFPLTVNGKLDREKLPIPQHHADSRKAPRTEPERAMAQIWQQILQLDRVAIDDNFFLLGGDSIKALQLVYKMRAVGYGVTVSDIFRHRTIERIARGVAVLTNSPETTEKVEGIAPLTPIQTWFFKNQVHDRHHYVQSVVLRFEKNIAAAVVREAFQKIMDHHDALRTTFTTEPDGSVTQRTWPAGAVSPEVETFTDDPETFDTAMARAKASLDLAHGPLIKLALFQAPDHARLFVAIHHLVVDTVSWRILIEDLTALLEQNEKDMPYTLPSKGVAFMAWSGAIRDYQGRPKYDQAKKYWQEVSQKKCDGLPLDFPQGSNTQADQQVETLRLTEALSAQLLTNANGAFGTQLHELLLTALTDGLRKTFDLKTIRLDVESHGRESALLNKDVSRTVGWFTTFYPVAFSGAAHDTVSDRILLVKEALRQIPQAGFDYGIITQLESVVAPTPSEISFNYLGQVDADLRQATFSVTSAPGPDVSARHRRCYSLAVSGIFLNQALEVSVAYSNQQYAAETIRTLLHNVAEAAQSIVSACLSTAKRIFSPSDFSYKRLSQDVLDMLTSRYTIQDIHALSPIQEGMLFHKIMHPASAVYVSQSSSRIRGDFDHTLFLQSLKILVGRHDTLRTVFIHEGLDRPVQVVQQPGELFATSVDLTDGTGKPLTEEDRSRRVTEFLARDRAAGFDLDRNGFRATALKLGPQDTEVIFSYHHILMDGWCMSLLLTQLLEIYKAGALGQSPALPAPSQFGEYLTWLQDRDVQSGMTFWKNYLQGFTGATAIPRTAEPTTADRLDASRYKDLKLNLGAELTAGLQRVGRESQVTLNTLFQVAWGLLLKQYNNSDDVVFGTVVSGRAADIAGVESMVGLFINTVPNRIRFSGSDTLRKTWQHYQDVALTTESHHHISLAEIQQQVSPNKMLFDHIFVFENYPVDPLFKKISHDNAQGVEFFPGLFITGNNVCEATHYDLALVILPGETLTVNFKYNQSALDVALIHQLYHEFVGVLQAMVKDPGQKIGDLQRVPAKEAKSPRYFIRRERLPLAVKGATPTETELPAPLAQQPASTALALHARMMRVWANVLEIDAGTISADANFFDIGGHSLKVTQLVTHLQQEFGVRVPIAEVFKHPTVEELALFIEVNAWHEHRERVPAAAMREVTIE